MVFGLRILIWARDPQILGSGSSDIRYLNPTTTYRSGPPRGAEAGDEDGRVAPAEGHLQPQARCGWHTLATAPIPKESYVYTYVYIYMYLCYAYSICTDTQNVCVRVSTYIYVCVQTCVYMYIHKERGALLTVRLDCHYNFGGTVVGRDRSQDIHRTFMHSGRFQAGC